MKKQIFFVLLLATLITGSIFAQDVFNTGLSTTGGHFGFETAFNYQLTALGFGYDFKPDLMDDSKASSSGPVLTGVPFLAGYLNLPYGLWSWLNKDYLGAGITSGAELVGTALMFVGGKGLFLGPMLMIGGMVYGYVRGYKQAKAMKASSLAQAISDDPTKHLSLAFLPTADGALAGSLTYSLSF